jgi:hypothetical protein
LNCQHQTQVSRQSNPLTLDQHIGVRIPGGQPKQINHLPPEYARTDALLATQLSDPLPLAHEFNFGKAKFLTLR